MPSWGEILTELLASTHPGKNPDWDGVRRKYLCQLQARTNRDTILYATNWMSSGQPGTSITLEDMQGMMEVCRGLSGPRLDIILHSPGGSAEAAASIVRYLRQKFTHIRVFVPLAAMSAATMWALAADEIVMGKHSQLGPIDPQLITPQGQMPARAVIEQFERAKRECSKNPSLLGAWMPILQQYGPALLQQCEVAEKLARKLVQEWLKQYMFSGLPKRKAGAKAQRVAAYFASHGKHLSHSIGIDRDAARAQGVNITNLESDQDLQDAVLSVHHATMHTFAGQAIKIIENHLGRAYIALGAQVAVMPMAPRAPTPPPAAPPAAPAAPVAVAP